MSSTRQPKRKGPDIYPTPRPAVESLRSFLIERGALYTNDRMLEPCRGGGNIIDVFPEWSWEWCELLEGRDYLNTAFRAVQFDWSITNPGFYLALEFLKKSLVEADSVAFLLRLNFLGSQKRRAFWQQHPVKTLLVLSERPSFTVNGKTDSTEYAWFIWSSRVPPGVFVR